AAGPSRRLPPSSPGANTAHPRPRQTRLMARLAVIRSSHHDSDDHPAGAHWTQTGYYAPLPPNTPSARPTHPSAGSITARLRGPNRPGIMPYVHIAPDPLGFPVFLPVHEQAYLRPQYPPFPPLSHPPSPPRSPPPP